MKCRFVHVPRTGGMSLYQRLGGRFVEASVIGHGYCDYDPDVDRWRVPLVGSHWPFDTRMGRPQVTLLRNPVERAMSLYAKLDQDRASGEYNPLLGKHFVWGPEHWFAHSPWVGNAMTKQLAGIPITADVEVSDRMFKRAKRNLLMCELVGITERYDDFAAELAEILCVDGGELVHTNRSIVPCPDTPRLRQIIESRNQYDRQLWITARSVAP